MPAGETSIETVQQFIHAWADSQGIRAALRRFMTSDCVYENIGMSKTTGPVEAIAFFDGFAAQLPFASIKVDMLAIVAQGDKVLTERVDHILDAAGKPLVSLRIMGIFELRDGKVAAWRDYFDTAPFATQ